MEVGLYGKLPSHGDFLRRRASDGFVAAWDVWLQQCLTASRKALGDRWLDVYLTSPVWRFTAAAGAAGTTPVIGLMAPSVDRVGRYFPLTIVAELPPHITPVAAATAATAFFDRAERLVVDTLDAEVVDFERFDQYVTQLADDLAMFGLPPLVVLQEGAGAVGAGKTSGWHLPIGAPEQLGQAFEQLLSHMLAASHAPLMVWWTEGSGLVEPSCLIHTGLPEPEAFSALLEGSWAQYGWPSVPARVESGPGPDGTSITDERPLRFRSAAASDVGRVRTTNQDSFIEHPDGGLWAVADGLGGHRDGDAASHMVCDGFADFVQTATFEDTIAAACARVYDVNRQLVRAAARSLLGDRSGSTVVALLARGSRCAILWAGDSRVYRWRAGRLEQLTRDHSVAESGLPGAAESHAITRAVGMEPTLTLDICREQVRPGDRFLLCSDGLTRPVTDAQIRAHMEGPDIGAAVQGLIKAALAAGAPDNVTALIVEASSDLYGLPG